MKKLSLLLVLSLVLSMMCVFSANAAETVSTWDGKWADAHDANYAFGGGDGSEANPFLIKSAADLAMLSKNSNNGVDYSGKWFKLTVDIVMNANYENYATWATTAPANTWNPIGNSGFKGNFDGAGHVIYGMYTNDTKNSDWVSSSKAGFFGNMQGTVKNLGFENCVALHTIDKGIGAGIIAGILGKTGNNAVATVSECYVKDSYVAAFRGGALIAGVANNALVENCYATGIVAGGKKGESDMGGFVAFNNDKGGKLTINNCYALPTFALVEGSSTNGSVIGNISGTESAFEKVYFDSSKSGMTKAAGYPGEKNSFFTDIAAADATVKELKVAAMGFDATVWEDGENGPTLLAFKPAAAPSDSEPADDSTPAAGTDSGSTPAGPSGDTGDFAVVSVVAAVAALGAAVVASKKRH